jgi:hypothetical protein
MRVAHHRSSRPTSRTSSRTTPHASPARPLALDLVRPSEAFGAALPDRATDPASLLWAWRRMTLVALATVAALAVLLAASAPALAR